MTRIALLLSLLAGCTGTPRCQPSAPAEVELRDGKGALVLAARRGEAGALDLCDANHLLLGRVKLDGSSVKLTDRGGAERLSLRSRSSTDADGARSGQPRLRVHREGEQTHVMQPDGVRFGTASTQHLAEKGAVEVFDRASVFISAVAPRGEDQAIAGPDGGTRWLVMRAASPLAAAMFALPDLDNDEKLALYLLINSIWRVGR